MSDAARDLDETRRLLYGVLVAHKTKRWEVVGTLANALAHHSGLAEDPYALLDRLVDIVEWDGTDDHVAWVRDTIGKLTALHDLAVGDRVGEQADLPAT